VNSIARLQKLIPLLISYCMKNSMLCLSTLVLLVCTSAKPPAYQLYKYNYENVLGTSFELKVNTSSEKTADIAEQIALEEIDRLNDILSTYNSDSEISRWLKTNNTAEKISSELFEVFELFDQWKEKTNGALNPSAAVAVKLWQIAASKQILPGEDELNAAIVVMNQPQWRLNFENHTAIHLTAQPLVLNSFVKSYIIHKVSDKVMSISGVRGAVVNIGGDIVVAGEQAEIIRIANPMADAENDNPIALLSMQNKSIATSGNYRRGFQIKNQWYSHILNVRTAMPVSEVISATVIANNATDAGALATAFNILSPRESSTLAGSIPGVEYQIVLKSGEEIVSEGWKKLAIEIKSTVAKSDKSEEQYEASIDLELARFEGRFHRPFVAVWVENKKKESVRTVAVWFNKPRWLPDLKRWFSKNQNVAEDHTALGSISSATRSAGKYKLTWDGLDDTDKEVPSGKYTIYIEAAREHGTYQLIKQDIDWRGKPTHFDLDGGTEVTSSSIDIHPKAGN